MSAEESTPAGEAQAKEAERSTASFATETERKVAQVFVEILEVQWASRDDDVFTLGGDSFEAVRVALELEYRFNVEFPVELLESAGRIRDLAAWIDAQPDARKPKEKAPA
jgi:acyl carrier protein